MINYSKKIKKKEREKKKLNQAKKKFFSEKIIRINLEKKF